MSILVSLAGLVNPTHLVSLCDLSNPKEQRDKPNKQQIPFIAAIVPQQNEYVEWEGGL